MSTFEDNVIAVRIGIPQSEQRMRMVDAFPLAQQVFSLFLYSSLCLLVVQLPCIIEIDPVDIGDHFMEIIYNMVLVQDMSSFFIQLFAETQFASSGTALRYFAVCIDDLTIAERLFHVPVKRVSL